MKELNSAVIRCEIFTFDGINNISNFIERVTGYRANTSEIKLNNCDELQYSEGDNIHLINKELSIEKQPKSKKKKSKIKLAPEQIAELEEIIKTNPEHTKKANIILKLHRKILQKTIAIEEGILQNKVSLLQVLFLSKGMNIFERQSKIKLTAKEIAELEEIIKTNPEHAKKLILS